MRGAGRWLMPYLKTPRHSAESVERVFITIADHFEPFHKTDRAGGVERMKRWLREYPESIKPWAGQGGLHPKHTHFFPIEQYDKEVVSMLTDLCAMTGSEVEVHLHHHDDTATTLRDKLRRGIDDLSRHDLLRTDATGRPRFCFVHGDWALANCHPQGRHCGVSEELSFLREMGCIADLTFPSAPSPTQPRRINEMYYTPCSGRPETLTHGPCPKRGVVPMERDHPDHLLLIQGVTAPRWSQRKMGILPRLENSDLTLANPPTPDRWRIWLQHAPRVIGQPTWAFIKLHTHGATPWNSDMHLGLAMRQFREFLATQSHLDIQWLTAGEMVQQIHAMEDG